MKASELRDKSVEELQGELHGLLEQQFKQRMKQASGQLSKTHEIGTVRRDIARVRTILSERQGK
ncbi:50S ribosomal protein L29 [Alcanivorax sp. JB21]|uniref:50S ribosomal protein L29 n=1 Tax=Alcanivorax limicola TaxID=2874102 RepID=UPI001CBC8F1D|nr:50S ribosomal protein L29 [Alcanivorax limicola]MBZ2190456.1 50S ribosomal protein L29 [Alcanivorax limicola]